MRALIMGYGQIGRAVAHFLALENFDITIYDKNQETLDLANEHGYKTIENLLIYFQSSRINNTYDVIVGCLPGSVTNDMLYALSSSYVPFCDVSFLEENPLETLKETPKAPMLFDMGIAPGLPNILIGDCLVRRKSLDEAVYYVGGLPCSPEPPLYHNLTWSFEGLIDEYIRPARWKRNFHFHTSDPLDTIEQIFINGKKYEIFKTDGLRSLLRLPIGNMSEYTIRHFGHLDNIKRISKEGLFDPINLEKTKKTLEPIFDMYNKKDFLLLKVKTWSTYVNEEWNLEFHSRDQNLSTMAYTTGLMCAIGARTLLKFDLEPGIYMPEDLGKDAAITEFVLHELEEHGITLSNSQITETYIS